MDLDLLDETSPMGKSKLPFEDFVYGGLTGVLGGPTGLAQTCHFWVSTVLQGQKPHGASSTHLICSNCSINKERTLSYPMFSMPW
jgi:hypothetical protein